MNFVNDLSAALTALAKRTAAVNDERKSYERACERFNRTLEEAREELQQEADGLGGELESWAIARDRVRTLLDGLSEALDAATMEEPEVPRTEEAEAPDAMCDLAADLGVG